MKKVSIFLYTVLLIIFISGCGAKVDSPVSQSSADWAYNFVVWNEDIYEISDERIESDQIDEELGEVKQYSDFEGIYGNGFSNIYPVGTKLFSIKGIEIHDYISVQSEEGIYIKAKDRGKYGGKD